MPYLESPTCRLDLQDPSNCLKIATAKPGQEIRVSVCVGDHPTATQLAVGALSNDGKSFSVVIIKEDGGQETHDLSYRDLLKELSSPE